MALRPIDPRSACRHRESAHGGPADIAATEAQRPRATQRGNGSYVTGCLIQSGARLNLMELGGLEPPTSWVRFVRDASPPVAIGFFERLSAGLSVRCLCRYSPVFVRGL
jgi:hypothetical protein